MTIIEREIEKRQELIDSKARLMDELKRLEDAVEVTQRNIAQIDEVTLMAEIEELKTYLPANVANENDSVEE